MESQLDKKNLQELDNYTLYAANTFMTATKAETSELAEKKYNGLLQNAPYDPNSSQFEKLEMAMSEAADRGSNSLFRRVMDDELVARLVAYPNFDRGTGESLARDYPELTGREMRDLKKQKIQDVKTMNEQRTQSNQFGQRSKEKIGDKKTGNDLKQVYAEAKARAQSVRQERSVQATPTFGAASERVSRIGLQKQETGLQR